MKGMLFQNFKKDILHSGFIGIGISLTLHIVTAGFSTVYVEWIRVIVFGFLVGFLITLGIEGTVWLFYRVFPNNQQTVIILLTLIYFVSVGIFYFFTTWTNHIFYTISCTADPLYISLGVGIPCIMISLFYIYANEKEEMLRLEQENKELVVVEERNRIARELHDSVSQSLFGISLNLNTLQYLIKSDPEKAAQITELLKEMVQEVQSEMRLMIYELKPLMLAEKGFIEAMESMIHLFRVRYNIDILADFRGEDTLASNKQLALYRVLQESLNNIMKHAQATKVKVTLTITDNQGELEIIDNGKGFAADRVDFSRHFGIQGMKERVNQLQGEFTLSTKEGQGTHLRVKI